MAGGPAYDGLLHLGSLAVVITATYLGIDRLRGDRKTLADDLHQIRDEVKVMLNALRLAIEPVELPRAYRIQPMYVLCYVAQVHIRGVPRGARFRSFFCKLYHVPLLRYFRSAADRKIVGLLAGVSISTYLLLILATIWHPAWIDDKWALTAFFSLFSAIIGWVFLTASIALVRLRQLGQICMTLKGAIIAEFQDHAMIDFQTVQATLESSILDIPAARLPELDE
jgi:hypothetical protein